jgi:hypothetical protein
LNYSGPAETPFVARIPVWLPALAHGLSIASVAAPAFVITSLITFCVGNNRELPGSLQLGFLIIALVGIGCGIGALGCASRPRPKGILIRGIVGICLSGLIIILPVVVMVVVIVRMVAYISNRPVFPQQTQSMPVAPLPPPPPLPSRMIIPRQPFPPAPMPMPHSFHSRPR